MTGSKSQAGEEKDKLKLSARRKGDIDESVQEEKEKNEGKIHKEYYNVIKNRTKREKRYS